MRGKGSSYRRCFGYYMVRCVRVTVNSNRTRVITRIWHSCDRSQDYRVCQVRRTTGERCILSVCIYIINCNCTIRIRTYRHSIRLHPGNCSMSIELTVIIIRSLTGCVAVSRRNSDSIKSYRCSFKLHCISNRLGSISLGPEQVAISITLIIRDVPVFKTVICSRSYLVQIGSTRYERHLCFIMMSTLTYTIPLVSGIPVQHAVIPVNDFAGCLVTARINSRYLHSVAQIAQRHIERIVGCLQTSGHSAICIRVHIPIRAIAIGHCAGVSEIVTATIRDTELIGCSASKVQNYCCVSGIHFGQGCSADFHAGVILQHKLHNLHIVRIMSGAVTPCGSTSATRYLTIITAGIANHTTCLGKRRTRCTVYGVAVCCTSLIPLVGLRTITTGSFCRQRDCLSRIVMICATYCHIRRSRSRRTHSNIYIAIDLIGIDSQRTCSSRPCIIRSRCSRVTTNSHHWRR